ncbi:MAG: type II secretion system protein GspM [bacterium]|nr:type II secretion system protein GspM [bacterium]
MKKISPRERRLVALAGAGILLFALYEFALTPLLEWHDRLGREIPKLREDLRTARRVQRRYGRLDGEVREIQERLDRRAREFNPHDFLSTLARREGILQNLEDIKVDSSQVDERYREEIASVKLRKVSLGRLVSYLYGIENSGHLLTVKELQIKPDGADSLLMDVSFDASTFRRIEEGEAAPAPPKRARPGRR